MKLSDLSVRRPVLAGVMNVLLLVFGIVAYGRIGVDLFPEVDFPVVTVTAVYPGADPGAVESKVVEKLEERINTLSGIKTMRSVSLENAGQVIVEFDLDTDVNQAAQDVRDQVSAALADLPPDIDPPTVEKFDIGAAPILSIALAGDMSLREVTRVAQDDIKDRLQKLRGVGAIDVVGGSEREIHVWVNRDGLAAYGLTVSDLAGALQAQNLEVPGGRMLMDGREFAVKTKGEVDSVAALGDIIVTGVAGAPVRVRDVARVEDGAAEERSASDLDGDRAVALVIRKQSGANTVAVAQRVKGELEAIRGELPAGMSLIVPSDNSVFIEASIHDVQFDLMAGAILTVLIIMLFLRDWRATLISAIALPTSVIATFGFMEVMGFTFNNMTMLALTLSIGILIDDAIVVIENIYRHREAGKSRIRAAMEGTGEIGPAVVAMTLANLAVFLPVATMKGIVGRFFFQFGLTVSFAIAVSMFVSFTLTPMLASKYLSKSSERSNPGRLSSLIGSGLSRLEAAYTRVLAVALRRPWATVGIAAAVFVGSLGLVAAVDKEFMPAEDRGELMVPFEMPSGTSLGETKRAAAQLRDELAVVPGVSSLFTTIGGGTQGQVNKGSIHVNLVERAQRNYTTLEAIEYVRAQLGERPPATLSVERVGAVSGGGYRPMEVQFNIRGHDFDELNGAAQGLVEELRKQGGYVDLDTTYRGGKPELAVNIDRDRAAELGVPVATIATAIRTLIAGSVVTDLPQGGERLDVRLRVEDALRRGPDDVSGIRVRGASGQLVELSNLVDVEPRTGPAQIERQDRQRQVTILANLEGKPLGEAVSEVEALASDVIPSHLTSDWTGMGDMMIESFGYMVQALILALILVYLILAAQFESLVHPFTIMMAVPLSMAGAFGALLLFGMSLNIFSMIGLIMLMGLVTKNAVLLVDYTNTLRRTGMSRREALLKAGPVRLRPILMTTAATVFGMLPVALGTSLGGEVRAPMAIAIMGGLISSTALTLLVVPAVYDLMDRFTRAKQEEVGGDAVSPGFSQTAGSET